MGVIFSNRSPHRQPQSERKAADLQHDLHEQVITVPQQITVSIKVVWEDSRTDRRAANSLCFCCSSLSAAS